jgi:hypothetical protein
MKRLACGLMFAIALGVTGQTTAAEEIGRTDKGAERL